MVLGGSQEVLPYLRIGQDVLGISRVNYLAVGDDVSSVGPGKGKSGVLLDYQNRDSSVP